jgi:phage FluMu gp28-like protein
MTPTPILLPYQQRWIKDPARFKVGMFARQTGKTFSTTLEIVMDCLDAEATGQRTRWVILSSGERQALEAMNEGVKKHLGAMRVYFDASAVECPWARGVTAHEVTLSGGSCITALPANPRTARGFSANVFLDEFAFHQDSAAIWKALFPVVSRSGLVLRVVSTPNGKGNQFYRLMTDPDLGDLWSRHAVDIYQAVADGLPRNPQELRVGMGDPDGWRQEFELEWLDEASAWLPYDLIDANEDPAAGEPSGYTDGLCFVGMDIAARGDLTVLVALEVVGDVLWVRELVTLHRVPFAEQLHELDRLLGRYRVARVAMDQTGMGEAVVEQAQRAHGASRVLGVTFTGPAKLDLATGLKQRLENGRLRLPPDRALRADLHSVTRETSATGIPRLTAERDGNGHADRFWALALAVAAAGDTVAAYDYRPVRPRDPVAGDHLRSRRVEEPRARPVVTSTRGLRGRTGGML